MRKINYQALRDAAEKATQGEWVAFISPGKYGTYAVHTPGDNHHGDIVDWPGFDGQKNAENNARYIAAFNPEVVQALLDEREAQSKRIAELEANFTVLAVENVGIKSAIPEPRDIEDDNDNMDDVSLAEDFGFNHAIEWMRRRIETPATDAFLADVRAGAFNDLCAAFVRHAKVAGLDDADTVTLKEVTEVLLHCAEQIRAPE
ncbi:ead/Ea22-like family protein [Escherichia coli]|uniref:Ead/Ea22-like family protein n=1 Tax=Escherichia coli TaxID=562 RepID=A0AAJ3D0H7_ECOLX|nr:ead/Ea22-like family protein [Escherichia coli]EKQ3376750.1 ead/Ea22-like family protein [Escherichia coli]ELT9994354.1 ead/Ea22-like family protein [Escherichia coli]MBS9225676.1 ead/Ea22-like family protein [Escherichia coli]MUM75756.1 ead/Ea22-like family protein [Escherichia coli]HAW8198392.1 ead/Ea22-like family protein [Escherichia coli]